MVAFVDYNTRDDYFEMQEMLEMADSSLFLGDSICKSF